MSFKQLRVWSESVDLAVAVYKLSAKLPNQEGYGLISQMQRAATSIPLNIAEGSQRSKPDFRRFCLIARGSAAELETQLQLVSRVYSLDCSQYLSRLEDIQKMLTKLSQRLRVSTNDER